ncbi:class I SAM-dependent methyltransferase [archaeon]|jgi:tRNA (uracil-5-)-methyltransferase TRM9|nr:class I SAM-dependent methyltransferase [archaeon]MBT3577982.1 class I SAM-dependent methyltransferase [archaeon]MBT6820585.1 class I SAM-dependent methyltransferase [archaeon]MBT6956520.1 class I SAM-dependent methyltransferase [archaeon]MBT7025836.1 class I SAM-dependent methyltransferase [archaeon]
MNQEKVWDKIAPRWNEIKNHPSSAVKNFLKGKKGKVLDLGSGSGRNFPSIPKNMEIYATDFSKEMLKFAEQKAKKLKLNLKTSHTTSKKIPFEDNYFDHAICIAVLHCIPTKKARKEAMKEILRTLKPNAKALISVWSRNSPRLKNRPKETYVPWTSVGVKKRYTYIYDREELEKEIENAGFKIINISEDKNIDATIQKI